MRDCEHTASGDPLGPLTLPSARAITTSSSLLCGDLVGLEATLQPIFLDDELYGREGSGHSSTKRQQLAEKFGRTATTNPHTASNIKEPLSPGNTERFATVCANTRSPSPPLRVSAPPDGGELPTHTTTPEDKGRYLELSSDELWEYALAPNPYSESLLGQGSGQTYQEVSKLALRGCSMARETARCLRAVLLKFLVEELVLVECTATLAEATFLVQALATWADQYYSQHGKQVTLR